MVYISMSQSRIDGSQGRNSGQEPTSRNMNKKPWEILSTSLLNYLTYTYPEVDRTFPYQSRKLLTDKAHRPVDWK